MKIEFDTKRRKAHFSIVFLLSFLFMLFFLIGGINNSSGTLSKIGYLAIGSLLVTSLFILYLNIIYKKYIFKKEIVIYVFSFLFISIYMIGIFNELSLDSVTVFLQITMVILFFWGITFISFDNFNKKIATNLIVFFIAIHFLWWAFSGFSTPFKGILANPNSFGAFIIFLLGVFWILYSKTKKKSIPLFATCVVLGLILVYASESRTSIIVALASLFTYVLWPIITKNKSIYKSYYIIFISFVVLVTVIYPKLLTHPIGIRLNLLSQVYTGKNFFSGRQVIWDKIIRIIQEKPILGYGPSARVSNFLETGLSAHNFYLQTTLQVGLAGITIFMLLLFTIWNYLYNAKNDNSIRIISSLFIGILTFQLFEVSFTQNNLSVALLQWLIIALGVFYTRKVILKASKIK